MRNAILNSSILLKVLSFDVILFITNKFHQMIFFADKDAIIFNFHHALFDFPSMNVFLHDLDQAYTTGQLPTR